MLAIEPRGDNGGDEELGAVAGEGIRVSKEIRGSVLIKSTELRDLRVGAGVGHGEQTGAGVLELEVLIGELLAVDGATTGTLFRIGKLDTVPREERLRKTHVVAGEVTTLEHELGDHTVEAGANVALASGLLAELTEVLGSLGDILLVEVEVDAANLL